MMTKERAFEVIEDLRDYVYENWEDDTYGEQLDEIGEAVDLIRNLLFSTSICGVAEINGKKYFLTEVSADDQ